MDKCIYNGKIINSFDIAADIDLEMEITSVENIKGRGMYMEVLCKEVKPGG